MDEELSFLKSGWSEVDGWGNSAIIDDTLCFFCLDNVVELGLAVGCCHLPTAGSLVSSMPTGHGDGDAKEIF